MSIPELINRAYFPPSPQHSWEEKRPIQLPSIRQAFPELHTAKPHGSTFQSEPHSASSDAPPSLDWSENPKELFPYRRAAYASHPEPYYTDAIPPRVYKSPAMRIRSDCSSSPPSTLHAKLASAKAAAARDRSVPFASAPTHTGLQSPPLLDSLPVSRPDYPSNQTRLPPLTLDPNVGQHQGWSGYSSDPSGRRATEGHQGVSPYDSPISPYSAYHPRMHSYPGSTTHAPNQHPHHDGYVGGYDVPVGAATKQRKRRGNLPKKTTDLLRAWFKMHLQHPYPTEDEKQELMRQTDLQMNQISNWFINARRRQLPAMINSAKAEVGLRNAKNLESKSEENGSDYGDSHRIDSVEGSEPDMSGEDDDFEAHSQQQDGSKRGSV